MPVAPITSASISAILAKVPLMVVSRQGRSILHSYSLPSYTRRLTCRNQALLQRASAVLPTSRESSARSLPRDVQRGVVSSPSGNPTQSRESTRCHRARGSSGQRGRFGPYFPERADGRAPLDAARPRPAPLDLCRASACCVMSRSSLHVALPDPQHSDPGHP